MISIFSIVTAAPQFTRTPPKLATAAPQSTVTPATTNTSATAIGTGNRLIKFQCTVSRTGLPDYSYPLSVDQTYPRTNNFENNTVTIGIQNNGNHSTAVLSLSGASPGSDDFDSANANVIAGKIDLKAGNPKFRVHCFE